MSLLSLLSFERMDITSHLRDLCKFVAAGEVPVRSLHACRQLHDVITLPIGAGTNHVVEHKLEVLGRLCVPDEEETGLATHRPKRHRLANDLERLLALEFVACEKF